MWTGQTSCWMKGKKNYFANNSNSGSGSSNKDLFVCALSKILIGHLVGTWCCCCTCFNTSGNLVQNCIMLCCCRRRHYHRWRTFYLSRSAHVLYTISLYFPLWLGRAASSSNLCFQPSFVWILHTNRMRDKEKYTSYPHTHNANRFPLIFLHNGLHMVRCVLQTQYCFLLIGS